MSSWEPLAGHCWKRTGRLGMVQEQEECRILDEETALQGHGLSPSMCSHQVVCSEPTQALHLQFIFYMGLTGQPCNKISMWTAMSAFNFNQCFASMIATVLRESKTMKG